jgi:hypothetical protein
VTVTVVDVEGALLAWATTHPTLTGTGNPIAAGIHLHEIRSPSAGAVGYVEVSAGRAPDEGVDVPRVSFEVRARNRATAEAGARALAVALDDLVRTRPTVTTSRAERVRLFAAGDLTGPLYVGDLTGEHAYRVDATIPMQAA